MKIYETNIFVPQTYTVNVRKERGFFIVGVRGFGLTGWNVPFGKIHMPFDNKVVLELARAYLALAIEIDPTVIGMTTANPYTAKKVGNTIQIYEMGKPINHLPHNFWFTEKNAAHKVFCLYKLLMSIHWELEARSVPVLLFKAA